MKTPLILALLVLAASCNPVRSGSRAIFKNPLKELQQDQLTVENEFSYQYTVNGCTTGLLRFASREKLCEGLMNNRLNNDCAYAERSSRYQRDCLDTIGYHWGGALQCEVFVMKAEAGADSYKPDETISQNTYCVGKTIGSDTVIPEVRQINMRYKETSIGVFMKAESAASQPTFGYSLYNDNQEIANDDEVILVPTTWETTFPDYTEAKLRFSCYPSAGCPKN